MNIRLFAPSDLPAVHHLLTSNRWEYFLDAVIDEQGLHHRDEKYFVGTDSLTFVCLDDSEMLLGFIRFTELQEGESPDFVLYVDKDARQQGVGKALLRYGVEYIFSNYSKIRRIEATTREDNIAMQKTFESLGFRKEAHYVKEWENRETHEYMDSYGYALLREEFI